MSQRLAGKRAVVIGAGQSPGSSVGMGRATAMLFAREGAQVALVDNNAESVQETADMMSAEGLSPVVVVGDITDADDCRRIVDESVTALGGIDVLQNTVGIICPGDPSDQEDELWDRVMDINLKAMWRMSKRVLPVMRSQRSGSIINYSSLAALPGSVYGLYGVSKAAVNALTMTLAAHNAPYRIRVNAIMPGLLDTPMAVEGNARLLGDSREAVAERRIEQCPMGYAGDAWDCAELGVYLASDAARYVSGACIPVDGAFFTVNSYRR
jgi:NAD(P)-dependent dehydrogenase (short-subunit alcohol dehydrogenase family)